VQNTPVKSIEGNIKKEKEELKQFNYHTTTLSKLSCVI